MKILTLFAALSAALLCAAPTHAAFIVEGHSSGSGNANFSYGGDTTSASASTASAAVGLTGTNSLFGGNGTATDTYVFSYTPGTDADNFSPAASSLLGSVTEFGTETASGAAGGGSGMYNVYWTLPATTNANADGSNFTITGDGAPIVLSAVNGNNGGTGADQDPDAPFVGGANNAWYKMGTVQLTAGTTYTVTQESVTASFVSMRSHAIMWEAVAVPEPASLVLMAVSGICALATRRRNS